MTIEQRQSIVPSLITGLALVATCTIGGCMLYQRGIEVGREQVTNEVSAEIARTKTLMNRAIEGTYGQTNEYAQGRVTGLRESEIYLDLVNDVLKSPTGAKSQ